MSFNVKNGLEFGRGISLSRGGPTDTPGLYVTGGASPGRIVTAEEIDQTTPEMVINELGLDIDFRVEGDTDANLLYVDAGNDRVGIGTSTPSVLFDVDGAGLFTTLTSTGDFAVTDGETNLLNSTAATGTIVATNRVAANKWVGLDLIGDNIADGSDNDEILIRFQMMDDGTPVLDVFGEIACVATDVSTGAAADGRLILRALKAGTITDCFTAGYTTAGALNFGFEGSLAAVVTITQTDSTAEATLASDTVTSIAATVDAATAGSIAAAVSSAQANVDEDGITAGAFIDRATRRLLVTAVNDMITHSTELDLDYEALLVDVAANRTWATEMDLDFEALIVDVRDLKSAFNSVVDALQAHGILG